MYVVKYSCEMYSDLSQKFNTEKKYSAFVSIVIKDHISSVWLINTFLIAFVQ